MVIYICPNCKRDFNRKSSFLYHVENKKKPCRLKDNINLINSASSSDLLRLAPSSSEFAPNSSDFPLANTVCENINVLNVNNETKIEIPVFKCDTCEMVFKKKYNLVRHQNGRCKALEQTEEIKQLEQIKKPTDRTSNMVNIDELDIDNKTKKILTILLGQNKKIIDEMKNEMEKMKEENKEMKEKMSKIKSKNTIKKINNNLVNTNNSTNTNTNNSHNTTNNQNNTINNTIIVAHGKEKLDKIELETIMKCLSTIQYKDIIPNITRHVYLNDSKPENKNFCVVDMTRNKCKYHDGNKWLIGKTTEKINKIFDNLHILLTDPFEKENINKTIEFIRANPKKFNEKWIKISNAYLKNLYDEDDKENIENKLKILEEIKLIFFNNKDEILQLNTIE